MAKTEMAEELPPRERVLCALARRQPDRVPFLDTVIAESVALELLGRSGVPASGDEIAQTGEDVLVGDLFSSPHYAPVDLARNLGLDGFGMYLFVRHEGIQQEIGGRNMVTGGGIASRADLDRIRLPDPNDPAIYEPYRRFIAENRESGYALYAFLNLGSDPAILGMGFERFALAIHEQPDLVADALDLYTDWYAQAVPHLCRLGFDFLWFGDDIAFKTAPYFSPRTFRELILPRYRKVAERVTLPWIFHSDGNLFPSWTTCCRWACPACTRSSPRRWTWLRLSGAMGAGYARSAISASIGSAAARRRRSTAWSNMPYRWPGRAVGISPAAPTALPRIAGPRTCVRWPTRSNGMGVTLWMSDEHDTIATHVGRLSRRAD